jgi:hypothetical protein
MTPTPLFSIGPLRFTGDVSVVGLVTLITLVTMTVKLINHLSRMNQQVADLWSAVMGKGPQDPTSFFNRFAVMESRMGEMWERLGFGAGALNRRHGRAEE